VLENYFRQELGSLREAVKREQPRTLIGASGSFDTFQALIAHRKGQETDAYHGRELPMKDYQKLHRVLVRSTLEERKVMPGMEQVRVEMIVAASIFVSFVIRDCKISRLYHSEFALKEGVISELVGI
jgi:exopolyphosphatase/guanosine-5'-triphosphate,3'-diphosphate pyrophosphatase